MSLHQEKGRELLASELKPKTVALLHVPGPWPDHITMWVRRVAPEAVEFYSGVHHVSFFCHVEPDGTLTDGTGRRIHVYEYLGEI